MMFTANKIDSLNRLSAGYGHVCADAYSATPPTPLRTAPRTPNYSQIFCWGSNNRNESTVDPTYRYLGQPLYLSAGQEYNCAVLRESQDE